MSAPCVPLRPVTLPDRIPGTGHRIVAIPGAVEEITPFVAARQKQAVFAGRPHKRFTGGKKPVPGTVDRGLHADAGPEGDGHSAVDVPAARRFDFCAGSECRDTKNRRQKQSQDGYQTGSPKRSCFHVSPPAKVRMPGIAFP